MPFLSSGGASIRYEAFGEGPPLLYVHEWNSSMELFAKTGLARYSGRFRVILFDLPGFGESGAMPKLSMGRITRAMADILDALGLGKAAVMGFCMGAVIALDFALRYPERTERLVLVDLILRFPAFMGLLVGPVAGRGLLRFFMRSRPGTAFFHAVMTGRRNKYRPLIESLVARSSESSAALYLRMLRRYQSGRHIERASSLRVPAACFLTRGSPRTYARSARALVAALPDGRLTYLPARRHYGFASGSARLARDVIAFLDEGPRG